MSDDERRHCERVAHEVLNGHVSARDWCTCGDLNCDKYGAFARVADLIQRERAGLLARAEAAEGMLSARADEWATERARWKDATVCDTPAEASADCDRMEAEADDLRAKLAASEARVAEQAHCMLENAVTLTRLARERKEAVTHATEMEAAACRMRDAILDYDRGYVSTENLMLAAETDDAGHGYLSPEQVARERAEARDAALEEAALPWDADYSDPQYCGIARSIRALKSRP